MQNRLFLSEKKTIIRRTKLNQILANTLSYLFSFDQCPLGEKGEGRLKIRVSEQGLLPPREFDNNAWLH